MLKLWDVEKEKFEEVKGVQNQPFKYSGLIVVMTNADCNKVYIAKQCDLEHCLRTMSKLFD